MRRTKAKEIARRKVVAGVAVATANRNNPSRFRFHLFIVIVDFEIRTE